VIGLVGLLRFKWTYLVVGLIIGGIGVFTYFSAHPSKPVEVAGTEASYVEVTKNNSYDRNELTLAGDSNTYTLDKTTFHPALPDKVYKGGMMQIWIDQGTTNIIAITLYDANDQNPTKYTTDVYDKPSSETSNSQSAGLGLGAVGAVLVAIFALWFVLGGRRRAAQLPAAASGMPMAVTIPQSAAMPGSSPGVSADGKWYWDNAQWRQVSDDGRYRWDGAKWVEMGTAYSAKGAPPPPATTTTMA
jgi:hypothetical protein